MGQTLSHGVYLPAEGERNCYSGLASNWNLLDTAIGDTAGKASATHTHGSITNDGKVGTAANKPLITGTGGVVQAGSFGNVANTFCEGNDSRLSDARTPVAHTHTKSDVTDLLNSNFIPSANNSYDLGSSSYQWNNLYAKNYYYNGTAWGLDKANVWSGNNTFTGNITINKNSASPTTQGDASLSFNELSNYIFFRTRGSNNIKSFNAWLWAGYLNSSAPNRYGRIRLYRASAVYGETGEETPDTSFSFIDVALHYKWVSLTDNVRFINDETANACEPLTNNATDLGTSTYKWKTLNGINPGALSLPSSSYAEIDTTNWDLTGATSQSYTPTVPGWLYISIQNIAGNYLSIAGGRGAVAIDGTGVQAALRAMLPVIANESVAITVKTGSIFAARFYPMLGNV